MMKIPFWLLLLFSIIQLQAQQPTHDSKVDSLIRIVSQARKDTAEVNALLALSEVIGAPDSMSMYLQKALALTEELKYRKGKANCLLVVGLVNYDQLKFSQSIQAFLEALHIYEELGDVRGQTYAHLHLQGTYREYGDYKNSLFHAVAGEQKAETFGLKGSGMLFPDHHIAPLLLAEIGQIYVLMNELDSALYFTRRSIDQKELFNGSEWSFPVYLLATIQNMRGDFQSSLKNYHLARQLTIQNDILRDTTQIFSGMSTLFRKMGQLDSAIYYAKKVTLDWKGTSEIKNLLEAQETLFQTYKQRHEKDSALKYMELYYHTKDSIFTREKDHAFQRIAFDEQLRKEEMVSAQFRYKTRVQLYAVVAGLLVSVSFVLLLWGRNRQKLKANTVLLKALNDLKATQTQLIQSEKMASLGELTAGIAHEIQNPLNFVNNFSEVSNELMDEMKTALASGDQRQVTSLSNDIKENLEKIAHHGKRADTIVKGMLMHSRHSSGIKEPTDINALCDEYLRLCYHGLRAKDKSFNATMNSTFDDDLGNINVIPQDIGRAILNLLTNAFYSVNEKRKVEPATYVPTVSIHTRKKGSTVEIRVIDNGKGIPAHILDKIFQPFYTSKPTGQGTGLGLSLSYDIITKGHGGELKVETSEGAGAEFIILLPIQNQI